MQYIFMVKLKLLITNKDAHDGQDLLTATRCSEHLKLFVPWNLHSGWKRASVSWQCPQRDENLSGRERAESSIETAHQMQTSSQHILNLYVLFLYLSAQLIRCNCTPGDTLRLDVILHTYLQCKPPNQKYRRTHMSLILGPSQPLLSQRRGGQSSRMEQRCVFERSGVWHVGGCVVVGSWHSGLHKALRGSVQSYLTPSGRTAVGTLGWTLEVRQERLSHFLSQEMTSVQTDLLLGLLA